MDNKKKIVSFKRFKPKQPVEPKPYYDGYDMFYCGHMGRDHAQMERLKKLTEAVPVKKSQKEYWPPIASVYQSTTPKPNRLAAIDQAPEFPLTNHYHFPMYEAHAKALRNFTSSSSDMNHTLIHAHLAAHGTPEDLEAFHRRFPSMKDKLVWPEYMTDIHDQIKTTSEALRVHRTPHALHLFTGAPLSPERNKQMGGVKRLHLPAFTSTSLDPGVGRNFSRPPRHFDSVHVYHNNIFRPEESRMATPEERELHHKYMHALYKPDYGVMNQMKVDHPVLNQLHSYGHLIHIHAPEGSHGAYVGHFSNYPEEQEFVLHPGALLHVHPKPTIDHGSRLVIWHSRLVHDGVNQTRFMK